MMKLNYGVCMNFAKQFSLQFFLLLSGVSRLRLARK
jgi:hypothetical protein